MLPGFLHIPSVLVIITAVMCVIGYGYELYKQLTKNGGLHMETIETNNNNKCEVKTAKAMSKLLTVGNLGEYNPGSIRRIR